MPGDEWPTSEDRLYNGLRATCLSDVKPLDEEAQRCCEAAYRRGYEQGVAMLLNAIRDGVSLSNLREWQEKKLFLWRYGQLRSWPMTRRLGTPPMPMK